MFLIFFEYLNPELRSDKRKINGRDKESLKDPLQRP